MPKGANVKGKGAGKSFSSAAKGETPICCKLRDNGRCDRIDCHFKHEQTDRAVGCVMSPSCRRVRRVRRVIVSVVSVPSVVSVVSVASTVRWACGI
jgi:hypothetical protein